MLRLESDLYAAQPEEEANLGPLLDVKFLLLMALTVVVTWALQQEWENRFAVPSGPNSHSDSFAVSEEDYRRLVVVGLDRDGVLSVNGEPVDEINVAERARAALAKMAQSDKEGSEYIVFNADPGISHGQAERIHLLLLRAGLTVFKEYNEEE